VILEFVPREAPEDILTSVYLETAVAVPRAGETVHLQLERAEPYQTYRVDSVAWQLDQREGLSAIVTVYVPSIQDY
jgi:hypothetical protein